MKSRQMMEFFTLKRMLLCLASLLTVVCVILAGLDHRGIAKEAQLAKLKSGSPDASIISNSSGFLKDKYPLHHFLSEKAIGEVKFLDPHELKEDAATAIIVLGDRPLDDTTPTVDMVYRVLKGVGLAEKYPQAIVIMSGGATKGPTPEARMMGLIAWSRGVDPLRIVLEDKSQTTGENAQNAAKIIGAGKIRQVFLVTEPSRLKEAVTIFQQYGKEFKNVQGVGSDVTEALIIEQMVQFLGSNDDRVVRGRLHYVKRGMKYKAFKFAVFPGE